ncbi:MAG: hypothetical protein LQ345_005115, partial [Seirophora villosa]
LSEVHCVPSAYEIEPERRTTDSTATAFPPSASNLETSRGEPQLTPGSRAPKEGKPKGPSPLVPLLKAPEVPVCHDNLHNPDRRFYRKFDGCHGRKPPSRQVLEWQSECICHGPTAEDRQASTSCMRYMYPLVRPA